MRSYYTITNDGHKHGPIDTRTIKKWLKKDKIDLNTIFINEAGDEINTTDILKQEHIDNSDMIIFHIKSALKCFADCMTKKYAMFLGKSKREDICYFIGVTLFIHFILSEIGDIFDIRYNEKPGILNLLFLYATSLPLAALFVRRLRDIGKNVWWFLIVFVPVIGALILAVWSYEDSYNEESSSVYTNPDSIKIDTDNKDK